MITGEQLVQKIEEFAPLALKMGNDPTGLQIGSLQQPVHRVLTTLDVRPAVVQEALEKQVDFIFAHHPVMFHPATNLDTSLPQNRMYADLLRNQITVYAAHTNLDRAPRGMNDWLAESLGLTDVQPFNYDEQHIALGRYGKLKQPLSIVELGQLLKEKWHLNGLRAIANDLQQSVQTIGIIGGSGSSFYQSALTVPVDLLITGDVSYHTGHDLLAARLPVLDPGHHIEVIFSQMAQKLLQHWNQQYSCWQLEILASMTNTEPFQFL